MSYANHPARPTTPPGGRSSINNYHSSSTSALRQWFQGPNGSLPATPATARWSNKGATAVPSGPGRGSISHGFPGRTGSLHDLSALERFFEGEAGEWEPFRKSDDELKQISRMKNGRNIAKYYERQNAILDGFQEVDLILTSHFPDQVRKRFATEEEIQEMTASRKARLLKKSTRSIVAQTVAGSESDSSQAEDDDGAPIAPGSLARAANAITGLWFRGSPRARSDSVEEAERRSLLPAKDRAEDGDLEAQRGRKLRRVLGRASTLPEIDVSHNEQSYGAVRQPSPLTKSFGGPTIVARTDDSEERPMAIANEATTSEEGSTDRRLGEDKAKLKQREKEKGLRDESNSKSRDRDHGNSERETAETSANTPGMMDLIKGNPEGKSAHPESQAGRTERDRQRLLASIPGLAEKGEELDKAVQFAININLIVNVLLLAGKAFAVLSSNSVSLLASLIDSALDLLSTVIIFATSKAIAYRSWHTIAKYPVGKRRFEPLGVVIFSVLMIASFCQVLVESIERLHAVVRSGGKEGGGSADLPLVGIIFMVATIGIKTVMWLLYRKSRSSGVRAVAQDAENDVVFNVASLIFPVIGSLLHAPAIDPVGGVVLSLYIIYEWAETLIETVTKLSGRVCGSQEISRALYLILRFKPVTSVSALECYHSGDDIIVEADVVLPHDIALKEAHDIGEVLTYALECLSETERAYVHLDYNERGPTGHLTQRG